MTEKTAARPATRRGPYAKSAQRRAEIVASATAVFAARGYRGGSLREIAKQLDLSLTSVVHHFPSKSALLVAVLENADYASIDSFESDSRGKGVAYAVLRYVRRNLERQEMLRLLALMAAEASAPDHPAHEWFRDRYERVVTAFTTAVRRDQDLGRISNRRDPELIAATLSRCGTASSSSGSSTRGVISWPGYRPAWRICWAILPSATGTRSNTRRPSRPDRRARPSCFTGRDRHATGHCSRLRTRPGYGWASASQALRLARRLRISVQMHRFPLSAQAGDRCAGRTEVHWIQDRASPSVLHLVAQLTTAWGTRQTTEGKTIWAEQTLPPCPSGAFLPE